MSHSDIDKAVKRHERENKAYEKDRVEDLERRMDLLEQHIGKALRLDMERPEGLGAPVDEVEKAEEQRKRDAEYLADRYQVEKDEVPTEPMLSGGIAVVSQEEEYSVDEN